MIDVKIASTIGVYRNALSEVLIFTGAVPQFVLDGQGTWKPHNGFLKMYRAWNRYLYALFNKEDDDNFSTKQIVTECQNQNRFVFLSPRSKMPMYMNSPSDTHFIRVSHYLVKMHAGYRAFSGFIPNEYYNGCKTPDGMRQNNFPYWTNDQFICYLENGEPKISFNYIDEIRERPNLMEFIPCDLDEHDGKLCIASPTYYIKRNPI